MTPVKVASFYNRSLERALQILCAFNAGRRTFNLSQLSQSLDLPKATVLRLCSTLIQYNFLAYNKQSKQYSLGLKLFELGGVVFSSFSIRKAASPHLTQLQSGLGKTVFLGILEDAQLVYIDKKEALGDQIRFASDIGTHRPPHFGMLGQTLMAFLEDHEVDRLLEDIPLRPFTRRSITDNEAFKERLQKIRKQGFHVDREEAFEGVTGIGSPVFDFTGKVVAGIGVGFISSSEDLKGLKRITREVLKTAQMISYELGYLKKNKTSLSQKK